VNSISIQSARSRVQSGLDGGETPRGSKASGTRRLTVGQLVREQAAAAERQRLAQLAE